MLSHHSYAMGRGITFDTLGTEKLLFSSLLFKPDLSPKRQARADSGDSREAQGNDRDIKKPVHLAEAGQPYPD